nr:SGNH hydrolase-type esterase domain-containing protein [Tanacetum cinerariifolium]
MDYLDNGNLNVYEWKLCYDECKKMYAKTVIFINKRLVRLNNVTIEKWLDLKYGDHTMVSNEVKESVIATWLIWSYKKQFKEYMEIKKQKEVYGLDADMEYDLSNVDFDEWLALKFSKYMTMDWYTKNTLWIYWTRGDDGDYGPWMVPSDNIEHACKPFRFKNGHAKWPTCNWKKEKYCNGRDLPEVIRSGDMIYFKSYEWYENLKEGELQDEALNSKDIFEGSKGVMKNQGTMLELIVRLLTNGKILSVQTT